ncbi:hypothetical protein J5Y09_09635 [Roseomonas sp. PWR1]|uniref:EF-hand domain-containing protein n=1 Tax=Roseomonas nitratireducens TaxID=2820810 RepID=A0ABS4AUE8_9PROT|nr:hypothetical protein [Neoroseomonas nitratireducens]MBP0464172.1 hypothetical protein [Neoroseomonas nitratireducens]
MMRLLILLLALAALPAHAQGVPEPLRGAWVRGACAAPEAVLQVSARGALRLPAEGAARLLRFRTLRVQEGWTIGTGGGAEAPRIMLRAAGDALETAEPDAKLRDDRLPGETELLRWTRCATPPASLLLLHGEGLAFLATLERLEGACQGAGTEACIAALVAEGDVSGDRLLGVAEIARLLRGAAWALAALQDSPPEGLAVAAGLGGVAAAAAARLLVESLDFDGDGRLSAAELGRDRTAWPAATGGGEGRPVAIEALSEGAGMLRALIERLAGE